MRASASSFPAGKGCSTKVTPTAAQAARFRSRLSGVHASLASTISSDSGAALRTAAIRSRSIYINTAARVQAETVFALSFVEDALPRALRQP